MELVDGITLDAWLDEPRSWRAIVEMFVAAGRGLEAAHDSGIVHRDFKPANVLVGRDGRPRVGDFGIAIRGSGDDRRGVGTPGYMSGEQWTGGEIDARSDQFAFCVALWRAVWGQAPFRDDDHATLRRAVLTGPRPVPPRRAPRWLGPLLVRGLERDPAARWPTLGALLDELSRHLAIRRRVSWLGVAASAIAASSAVVVVTSTRAGDAPCAAPTDRVEPVWGSARRAELERHARTVDPALGGRRFVAVAGVLDPGVAAWSAMNVAACRATRVDHRQSDSLFDLRVRCLDDWLGRVDRVADGLARARDPDELAHAVQDISNVGALERCADAAVLQAVVPQPTEPGKLAAVRMLDAEIGAIDGAVRRRGAAVLDAADRAVAQARALGHAPSLTAALATRARIAEVQQDVSGEIAILREAVEAAARAHDDEAATVAWATLVRLVGYHQGRTDEAKAIMPAARAASARIGDPPLLLAMVLTNEGHVLVAGDPQGALAALERARELLVAAGADRADSPAAGRYGSLLQALGSAYLTVERFDDAERHFRAAIAVYDRTWGPDTPESGFGYMVLGEALQFHDRAAAERALRESVRIRRIYGDDTVALATSMVALSEVIGRRGDAAEAVAMAERAAALARSAVRADDQRIASILATLADQYTEVRRYGEALAVYDEVLAIAQRGRIATRNVAAWWINRAEIARTLGRCDTALADYRRGAELAEQFAGKTSGYVAAALNGTGWCLIALGRTTEAIAPLEQSVAHEVAAGFDIDVAKTRAKLAELRARRTP